MLKSDNAVLNFGADNDVNLTHVPDTGLLLNSNMKLQFRDSAVHISSDADGYLNAQADTGVNININGAGNNFLTGAGGGPPPTDAVGDNIGTVLAGQITNSPTIIFTAKRDFTLAPAAGDTVHMTIAGRAYEFSGNLHVLKQNARFIAEFSIVAKN